MKNKLSKEEQARKVIKQGLVDAKKVVSLLEEIEKIIEEHNAAPEKRIVSEKQSFLHSSL